MTSAPTGIAGSMDPDCTIRSLYKFCAGMSAPVRNSATAIVSSEKVNWIILHDVFTFLGQTNYFFCHCDHRQGGEKQSHDSRDCFVVFTPRNDGNQQPANWIKRSGLQTAL